MLPLIGVTATIRESDGVQRVRLNESYVRALEMAGMLPLVLPPITAMEGADSVLGALHGLVLTGGEDANPSLYGAVRHPRTQVVHPARDVYEIALVRKARELAVPALAICRGVQLVNIALGGTLVQDIPSERPGTIDHDPDEARNAQVHDISVESGSRLASALGTTALRVNSSHHQAIDRVADGLRVSAVAADQVIEAVESTDPDWWMVGVQWHPEELMETAEPWHRKLFAAFAAQLGRRRTNA